MSRARGGAVVRGMLTRQRGVAIPHACAGRNLLDWSKRLAGLLLVLCLPTLLGAGVPADTFTVTPGPFELPSRPLAQVTSGHRVQLCLTFVGFDDASQRLTYLWQVSDDNEATWDPWVGAEMVGGVHLDRLGQPLTQFCAAAPPRFPGPGRMRLTGTLTSPTAIDLTFSSAEEPADLSAGTRIIPSLIQSHVQGSASGADNLQLAYLSAVSANHLLVAYCGAYQGATYSTADATFSDTLGNIWTVPINVGPGDGGTGNEESRLWGAYTISGASGTPTVTCNAPGVDNTISMVLLAVSNVQTTTPLDQSAEKNNENGTTTPNVGPTAATTVADGIVIAGMIPGAPYTQTTITAQAPCVLVQHIQAWASGFEPIAVCAYTVSSMGTQSASWVMDTSNSWAAGIAAFQGAAAAAAVVRRGMPFVFP